MEQSVAVLVKQFAGKMQLPDVGRSFNSFLRSEGYNIWVVETPDAKGLQVHYGTNIVE